MSSKAKKQTILLMKKKKLKIACLIVTLNTVSIELERREIHLMAPFRHGNNVKTLLGLILALTITMKCSFNNNLRFKVNLH